jgi:hypothetical protein
MLYDGLHLTEGSVITNASIATGTTFPATPDAGELYFRTDLDALHVYNGTIWVQIGSSSSLLEDQPGSYYLDNANATGTMSILHGGTGATTAATARSSLGLVIGTDVQAFDADLSAIAAIASTSGLLKKTAANTWSLDTSTYLTGNQSVALSGDITGSGATAITTTLATVNANVGAFGSGNTIPVITVNAKGLVTAVTTAALSASFTITGDVTGTINGGVDALTLATVNANVGTTGSASLIPVITVNAKGLVTGVSTAQIASTSLTDFAEAVQDTVAGFIVNGGGISATYADVGNTLTLGSTATNLNTASAIVARDASGNFAAGTITAALTGTASNATNTAITDDTTLNASVYPTWVTAVSGNNPQKVSSSKMSFNPSTGTLTATAFVGSGAGLTNIPSTAFTSSFTLGSTVINLGDTVTTVAGLTSVTSTTFVGALTGNASTATRSTNIAGGVAGAVPYQTAVNATALTAAGTSSQVLVGGTAPAWSSAPTISGANITAIPNTGLTNSSVTIGSTAVALGATVATFAGLTSVTSTTFVGALSGNATTATTATNTSITEDVATVTAVFPTWVTANTGGLPQKTTSTKLTFVPSTGTLSASIFSGSGASLTAIPNAALTNSSVTIGSTAVALGATVTAFTGLTSVTSTAFVGALTGNASTSTAASTVTIANDAATATAVFPTWVGANTGNLAAKTTSTKLTFVPSTGVLSATSFTGAGTGLTAIPNAALTNSSVTIGSTDVALGAAVTTFAGLTSVTSTAFVGALTGNASTATTLATGRTIAATGDATWTSPSFNGSANVTAALTLATVNAAPVTTGFHKLTTNAKGLVTATTAVVAADITGLVDGTYVNVAGDTMTGSLSLNADPTSAMHAATKQYVDNVAAGINIHGACETATATALTATYVNGTGGAGATLTATTNVALGTIGGYTGLVVGSRLLVKDQPTSLQNGIYVVTNVGAAGTAPWILTRATDFDGSPTSEISAGELTYVQEGSLAGTQWVMNSVGTGVPNDYITMGVDPITFTQFSGAGTYSAGTGIGLSSNVISNTGVLSVAAGTNISVTGATGNVTIAVTGTVATATTATSATNTAITDDTTAVGTMFPTWVTSNTGGQPQKVSSTKLTFVPSTGILSATSFTGAGTGLTGTASSLTVGNAANADNSAVTNDVATATAVFPVWVGANTGDNPIKVSSTKLTFVPSTGVLTSTSFTGAGTGLTGTASSLTAGAATNTTITNDVATAVAVYPTWVTAITGNLPQKTSSTSLSFVPSTGVLSATSFTGSGAGLTSIPNTALTNSSVTIGSTAVALGAAVTAFTGLTSVTSTAFVGALTGNASTATTAAALTTGRSISITGDATWTTTFSGSANVTAALTLATVATAGTYTSVTVNAKGLVTAGTNPTTLAGYGITDAVSTAGGATGALTIDSNALLDTASTAVTTTTATTIASFATATYRTAKYLVQVTDTTNSQYHAVEILLIHNGATVFKTEYGEVSTNGALGTFDASITTGTLSLQFTATAATTKTVKVYAVSMTV